MGGRQSSLRPSSLQVVDEQYHASCVHHWVLAEPQAGRVPGSCKHCGATRSFPGSPEGSDRFDDYREITQSSTYYTGGQASA